MLTAASHSLAVARAKRESPFWGDRSGMLTLVT
jgi:hypothetical protein